MTAGEPAPPEVLKWVLAEQYGWTLEYISSLPVSAIHEWMQIQDGKGKAREYESNRNVLRKNNRR